MKHRAFAIYRFHQYKGKKGYWERCKSFHKSEAALNSLKDLTKVSKKRRIYAYAFLPNQHVERWMFVKDHEQLLKSAR